MIRTEPTTSTGGPAAATTMVSGGKRNHPRTWRRTTGRGGRPYPTTGRRSCSRPRRHSGRRQKRCRRRVRVVRRRPELVTSGTCDPGGELWVELRCRASDTAKLLFSTQRGARPRGGHRLERRHLRDPHRRRRLGARLAGSCGLAPGCGNGEVPAIFNATSGRTARRSSSPAPSSSPPRTKTSMPTSTSRSAARDDDTRQPGRSLPRSNRLQRRLQRRLQ